MKINPKSLITPINITTVQKEVVKSAQNSLENVQKHLIRKISAPSVSLERQAEMMTPQEYINARTYLSELEQMQFMRDCSIF